MLSHTQGIPFQGHLLCPGRASIHTHHLPPESRVTVGQVVDSSLKNSSYLHSLPTGAQPGHTAFSICSHQAGMLGICYALLHWKDSLGLGWEPRPAKGQAMAMTITSDSAPEHRKQQQGAGQDQMKQNTRILEV